MFLKCFHWFSIVAQKTEEVRKKTIALLLIAASVPVFGQQTYSEKLGFPSGSKVLILHVDDAGMSWDSNEGARLALTEGVASSVSVMMPCPWVPGFVKFLKNNPTVDAGLHLTLTSEWDEYRWYPLSGKKNAPGLVDKEGAMWASVENAVAHATADEVEQEILAHLSSSLGHPPQVGISNSLRRLCCSSLGKYSLE